MCATPILLGRVPALLPSRETSAAIEGLCCCGRRTAKALVVATVAFLFGRPSECPMLLPPLAIEGFARMSTDGTTIGLLIGIPDLPTLDRHGAIVNQVTSGCGASSALMLTTPRFLGVVPRCLPMCVVHVAIVGVACTTCIAATPSLLVLRPAFLPFAVPRIAIVRLLEGRGLTTFLFVSATPIHFRIRPSQLPNCILDFAIERVASPSCGVATPSLLIVGPTSLPIVETLVAIEGHCSRLNQATHTCSLATMLLLLGTPTFSPILDTLLAIELSTGLACGLTAELFLVITPALLPLVDTKIAIVEHSWRSALASSTEVLTTIVSLLFIPLCTPLPKTEIAIKLIAALARLDATPRLLAVRPLILPIRPPFVAIMAHRSLRRGTSTPVVAATIRLLRRTPLVHPVPNIFIAVVWLTRLSSVLAAPILLTLWPTQFPIVEANIAIEWLRSSGDRTTAIMVRTTPSFLAWGPNRLPVLFVVFGAIERVARPASVRTTPLLLVLRPLLPIVEALCAILNLLRGCGHNAATQISILAAPTLLLV